MLLGVESKTIHFSLKNQSYVKDDNYILVGYDILKALSFNGDISGTTDVLVDAKDIFGKGTLEKNKFQNRNWSTGNT